MLLTFFDQSSTFHVWAYRLERFLTSTSVRLPRELLQFKHSLVFKAARKFLTNIASKSSMSVEEEKSESCMCNVKALEYSCFEKIQICNFHFFAKGNGC